MLKKKYSLEIGKYLVVKIDGMFDLYLVKVVSSEPLIVMASESDRHRLNYISYKRFVLKEELSIALQEDLKNGTETVLKKIGKNLSLVTELPEFGKNNSLFIVTNLKLEKVE